MTAAPSVNPRKRNRPSTSGGLFFNPFGAPFRLNYMTSCEESVSPRRGVHFSGLGAHF